jgi:hypothetical protein
MCIVYGNSVTVPVSKNSMYGIFLLTRLPTDHKLLPYKLTSAGVSTFGK